MSNDNFDLIVIGSGPGGEKGAAQAAYFGKSVAIIEREGVPGGAAANTGTLPSKTLRESALYLSGFRQRELHGVGSENILLCRDVPQSDKRRAEMDSPQQYSNDGVLWKPGDIRNND